MSKVSSYLQSHILGEVMTRSDVCEVYARDGSVLSEKPDMVIHPRTINDVRKVLRFCSQLADKGHVLSVLPRGKGTSTVGSAISNGAILDLSVYLSSVLEYEPKRRLVRVQAGTSFDGLINALRLHGTTIPTLRPSTPSTIGGLIGEGYSDRFETSYRQVRAMVSRLEVVLPGGEIIQTGPITKRELSKKKGLPGAEGDIYRGIDAILEDYSDVVDEIKNRPYREMVGYPGVADVVNKKGTFDLTPLFVGAAGTLGVVVEAILQAEFRPAHVSYAVAVFRDSDTARDALDVIRKHSPSFIEYIDASIVRTAHTQRVEFDWFDAASEQQQGVSTVIVYGWEGFGDRRLDKSVKKSVRDLKKLNCYLHIPKDDEELEQLDAIFNVSSYARYSTTNMTDISPEIVGGFHVPHINFESFSTDLIALGRTLHLDLPMHGSALSGVYTIMPQLSLKKVGDKQKIFKLVDQLMKLVEKHSGVYYAHGGEGRLTSHIAFGSLDERHRDMIGAIKRVFDQHGILNAGVKQDGEITDLVKKMRSDNTIAPHLANQPSVR